METDVLIVGAGIAGLSTAWWLAREAPALSVLLLERSARLGTGSSGRSAAILRTFGADPVTNAVARAGARALRDPGSLGAGALHDPCGLVLGASGEVAGEMQRWAALDPEASFERLTADKTAALLPYLRRAPDLALGFSEEGRIEVAALLEALARALAAARFPIRTGTRVRELLAAGDRIDGVTLEDGRELRAQHTVLAAGGWAAALGRRAGSRVEMQPTRRHLLVTRAVPALDPRTPVVWLEDARVYLRPEESGFLACACDTEPWDPEVPEPFAVDPRQERRIHKEADALLREPLPPTARSWSGIRTLTADGRFAVGPDPDLAGLFWVAGLGGHGMTAGLEVGRLAARQLLGQGVDQRLAAALAPARLVAARRR